MKRPEKKSESLEIRLPYSQKLAFMEACREDGTTASDTLRRLIADELERKARPEPQRSWTMTIRNNPLRIAAGFAGTALAAATFGAGISMADDEVFDAFDRNGDGAITYSEFLGPHDEGGQGDQSGHRELFEALDIDNSQTLDRDEFEGRGSFSRRSDRVIERDGKESRVIGVEVFDYDLAEEGSTSISITAETRSIDPDTGPEEVERLFAELETKIDEARKRQPAPPVPPAPPRN